MTNQAMYNAVHHAYRPLPPLYRHTVLELALETRYYPCSAPSNIIDENGNRGFTANRLLPGDYAADDRDGITKIAAAREFWYHRPLA